MLLVVLFVPYTTTEVPEWPVQVIYSDGQPVVGSTVIQHWHIHRASNSDIRKTDENGRVVFPARTYSQGLLLRGLLYCLDILNYVLMMHGGSIGTNASISSEVKGSFAGLRLHDRPLSENQVIIHKLVK